MIDRTDSELEGKQERDEDDRNLNSGIGRTDTSGADSRVG